MNCQRLVPPILLITVLSADCAQSMQPERQENQDAKHFLIHLLVKQNYHMQS